MSARAWTAERYLGCEHVAPTPLHPGAPRRDRRAPGRAGRCGATSRCAAAHFSLIPLMVAQSLLVLTTGRLFCSRYVDTLPVQHRALPGGVPAADLLPALARPDARRGRRRAGCASRCARWRATSAPRLHAARALARATEDPAWRRGWPSCGDLLDFTADPGLGRHRHATAVRWRPDHWLLVDDGRIAGVQPRRTRRRVAGAHDHRGRLLHAGLRRHPRAHARSST
ncbi:MAG: hypothetical protein MZW92_00825 [Comamonadaceae bacterium]|nr:hypothetical protein [Comamonadaceae bacterium]